jgi:hypothetical protein
VSSYPTRITWDPISEKLPAVPQAGAWEAKSMSILARWSSAYDAYLNIQGDNLTDTKRKGTAALCILKELGSTSKMLSRTRVNDERDWDVFCPMFQKVVSLAEDIVKLDRMSDPLNPKKFCIDMAIVGPLFKVSIFSIYFSVPEDLATRISEFPHQLSTGSNSVQVSCRCRDPIIRRRAISILQKCGRIEGEWDALLTSKVAQRVLDIEESGLRNVRSCDDVPEWARVSNVFPALDPRRSRASLVYSRLGSEHDLTRQTKIEVITW